MFAAAKAGEFGEVFAQNVGCTLRLGDALADARGGEASLEAFEFAVDAFFHPIGDCSLQFIGVGFRFLETGQALFPFGEFGIT